MIATEIIKKKRSSDSLTFEEVQFFVNGYTKGEIPDYQMASLLMAIFLNGMTTSETVDLTQVMLESGERVHFDDEIFAVDKHSTGGVGDKTSLILAPLVAACGVPVPMMSGRGLGHTGGTLDKLESIPDFNVFLSLDDFKKMVSDLKLSFIGQTDNICPADKKIYSLRDVTSTVESLPLICASIMSKKIAEGIKGLVLDVKFGPGAFMKTKEQAKELAKGLMAIGKGHDISTHALITSMNQPLGRFVGNSLEVGECLSILKRENFKGHTHKNFKDTEELSVALATKMVAVGKQISESRARAEVESALETGRAYDLFAEVTKYQGGDLSKLPMPTEKTVVTSPETGYLESINGEAVGVSGIMIGAGRKVVSDKINPVSGIEIHHKIGDQIEKGDPLFTVHTDKSKAGVEEALKILKTSFELSEKSVEPDTLISDSLN